MNPFATLQPEVDLLHAALADLAMPWREQLSFQLHADETRTFVYDCYPYLFLEAFPALTPAAIRSLAVAGRLFATSVFVADGVMDGQTTGAALTTDLLRLQALQFEAYQKLYQLFPPASPFWLQMRGYLAAYVDACLLEQQFTTGERSWSEFTETVAGRIITGKCGVAKCVVAALATLADQPDRLPALTASIDHYYIAFQLWDDLQDWKEDLAAGRPSLLLARLLVDSPADQEAIRKDPQTLVRLTRKLYYHHHAQALLQLGQKALAIAQAALQELPPVPWSLVLAKLAANYQQVATELDAIVAKNIQARSPLGLTHRAMHSAETVRNM
jgi:geranylgeranyl pyrophosphate synthase